MTHVTCRLTAENRDHLQNPTLGFLQGKLPSQPIFVGSSSVHKTGFACDAVIDGGVRQEVQLLRWTQANQLTDQSTIFNRRLGG